MDHCFFKYQTSYCQKACIIFCLLLFSFQNSSAQQQGVSWLTFEHLEDSLAIEPKKVFISFYADWCAYCKKMDETAFKNREVISKLNSEFYAVKMNSESLETITFEGRKYKNLEHGQKRNPTHELALLLASRKNQPFTLPATIVLNEQFEVTQRHFRYLSPKAMLKLLQK